MIGLLLLLLGTAQASTLVLPEAPPVAAATLRGDLRVEVSDHRPPEQRSAEGAVLVDAHDPILLSGDLSARIQRLGQAAVRAEGGWAGDEGPTLTLTLRSFLCSPGRTPTCTLLAEAAWGDGDAFILISAVGAGPPDLATAAAQSLDRLSARLRTALQVDAGFAQVLATSPSPPAERSVAIVRWIDGERSRTAELLDQDDSSWCVADSDGVHRVPFEGHDLAIVEAEVRAEAGSRWVVADTLDGKRVSGTFVARLDGGVVVHTGTRRRLLHPGQVSTLFVSPDPAEGGCPIEDRAGPRDDALLLVDGQGRPLTRIHFDFERGMAQSTHVRAVRRDAPDSPLTMAEFLDSTGSETLRLRNVALAERLGRKERGGHGMAALGGGFLAIAGGLTAYSLIATATSNTPLGHGSPGDALGLALPLAVIAGPVLGGGLHARDTARARRRELEAGHLELLRSPRDLWLSVQEANESPR